MARKKKGIVHYTGTALIYTSKAAGYFIKGAQSVAKGVGSAASYTAKKASESKTKTSEVKKTKPRPRGKAKYSGLKEIKKIKGKAASFEKFLHDSESLIGIILGARGTGKSAIGMKLLENIYAKTKKQVYAIGFNAKDIPNWINAVESTEEIENDSVVLIDESGISFSSRKAMSDANQMLSSLLLVARHKNLSILFITQNSSNLEVNVLRQADFLVMKPSSLMQKDFERKKIKEVYESVDEHFEKFKGILGLTYIHSDKYKGFVVNELPSFWSTKVSKAFKEK